MRKWRNGALADNTRNVPAPVRKNIWTMRIWNSSVNMCRAFNGDRFKRYVDDKVLSHDR
jgi:hypothetical protein